MRKRLVVAPKDHVAENDLNYDRQSEDQIIEYSLSEEKAEILCKTGVFDCINRIANTLIDGFEEDWITDHKALSDILNELIFIRYKCKEHLFRKAGSIIFAA